MERLRERDAAREQGHRRDNGAIRPLKLHMQSLRFRARPAAAHHAAAHRSIARCRPPHAPIALQALSDDGARDHCRCIAGPP